MKSDHRSLGSLAARRRDLPKHPIDIRHYSLGRKSKKSNALHFQFRLSCSIVDLRCREIVDTSIDFYGHGVFGTVKIENERFHHVLPSEL